MKPENFWYLRDLIRRHAAIVLEPEKQYLIRARLNSLAKKENLESVDDLVEQLRARPHGPLNARVVESLVTTETSFFRDIHPYETLKEHVFPELLEKRKLSRTLYLWSAACASGQEPYSLSIMIREFFPHLTGWTVRVMASDLSSEMIERAKSGRYTQLEVNRGMPSRLLIKYFKRDGVMWQVNDEIRTMVEFKKINLADPFPPLLRMDVVFLRNVLIYFDDDNKREILAKIARQLRPDGFLFVGGAETLIGYDQHYRRIRIDKTSCYQPLEQ